MLFRSKNLPSIFPNILQQMNIRISPLEDSSRLGEVFALYRKSSATLGNMPRGGFVEGQAKGTLLGAFDRDEMQRISGPYYCLF